MYFKTFFNNIIQKIQNITKNIDEIVEKKINLLYDNIDKIYIRKINEKNSIKNSYNNFKNHICTN